MEKMRGEGGEKREGNKDGERGREGGGREVRRKKAFFVSRLDCNIILFYPEKLSA